MNRTIMAQSHKRSSDSMNYVQLPGHSGPLISSPSCTGCVGVSWAETERFGGISEGVRVGDASEQMKLEPTYYPLVLSVTPFSPPQTYTSYTADMGWRRPTACRVQLLVGAMGAKPRVPGTHSSSGIKMAASGSHGHQVSSG